MAPCTCWHCLQHRHAHGEASARQARWREAPGAGKRASTLRSRIRAVRQYVRDAMHVVGYLQMRLAGPSGKGAIKGEYQAMAFFEEVSGVPDAERCSSSALYLLAKKEVLAAALSGAEPREVPDSGAGSAGRARRDRRSSSPPAAVPLDPGQVLGHSAILGPLRDRALSFTTGSPRIHGQTQARKIDRFRQRSQVGEGACFVQAKTDGDWLAASEAGSAFRKGIPSPFTLW